MEHSKPQSPDISACGTDNELENNYSNNTKLTNTGTSNEDVYDAGRPKDIISGYDYQLRLLMWFALQGEDSGEPFRLATEITKANKFDDLVFIRDNSNGKKTSRCLQAKQTKSKIKVSELESNSDNKMFSLQKYFVSYIKTVQQEDFGDVLDFIICTNTDFDFETNSKGKKNTIKKKEKWKKYFSEKTNCDKFLNMGGKCYHFSKDQNIRNEIISDLKPIFEESLMRNKLSDGNIKMINDFLNKLVFVNQVSKESLEEKIKDTLNEKKTKDIDGIIYNHLFTCMSGWMNHKTEDEKAHFLTNEDIRKFLREGMEKIDDRIGSKGSYELFEKEFKRLNLVFKDSASITKFLNEQNCITKILIVCSKSGFLSYCKVSQILSKKSIKFSLSPIEDLGEPSSYSRYNSKNTSVFITILDKFDENLLKSLYNSARKEENKQYIVITQPEKNNNLKNIFESETDVTIIEDNNKLGDLTPESIDKVLETEITLFEEKVKLSSLTTNVSKDDLCSSIDENALNTIIEVNGVIKIGSKPICDIDRFNIPRTLSHQTLIDKKCLMENEHDKFVVSNIEESEFSELVPKDANISNKINEFHDTEGEIRYFIFDINKFNNLPMDKDKTVHFFEYKNGALEWKKTHGFLRNLRRFLMEGKQTNKNINDLTDSAIISGEPGSGKSTLLSTYSIKTDSLWPIRINLKCYEDRIQEANFDNSSGLVTFLSNVIDPEKSKMSLIQSLLQYCLQQQGQITLLLDGYDEIKDCNKEKVVQLFRTLKTTQAKVLLTVRSYARSELEDVLGVFAYTLNPFDEKEQKQFLNEFWKRRLNVKEKNQEENIVKFAEKLQNHFHELKLMKSGSVVGIALQARMMAEIFQDECKKYLKCENFNVSKFTITNIFHLYQTFIKLQYKRWFEDNGRIKIIEILSEGSREILIKAYTKEYYNLALKSLFSEHQIQGLLKKKKDKEESVDKEIQSVGLLKDVRTAEFVHPTYAEYFVADRLVDTLAKGKNHPKYKEARNFLIKQIFRDHNKVIHEFIENKINQKNDSNLSREWKEIKNCDLLKGKVEFQLSIIPDNVSVEKELTELLEEFKNQTPSSKGGHYYNYKKIGTNEIDLNLVHNLFDSFMKESSKKKLKTALDYFLEIRSKGGIRLRIANEIFEIKFNNARHYYLAKLKKEELNLEYIENLFAKERKYLEKHLNDNELKELIASNKENCIKENQVEKIMSVLLSILEDKDIEFVHLSYLSLLFECCLEKYVDSMKTKIVSNNESKEWTDKIIQFLFRLRVNIWVGNFVLRDMTTVAFLKQFFINIVQIEGVKNIVNQKYKQSDYKWLEKNGVLFVRFLDILTPEMSEAFFSCLKSINFGYLRNYSDSVFINLINYFVDRIKELPKVDNLAFIEMLVHFVRASVERNKMFPFTSKQLKATLNLISNVLHENHLNLVEKSIKYLCILGTAGLKVIEAEKDLLVIDPSSEFECTLSGGSIKTSELIAEWKNENRSESQEKFVKGSDKQGGLKRKCENDLPRIKKTRKN